MKENTFTEGEEKNLKIDNYRLEEENSSLRNHVEYLMRENERLNSKIDKLEERIEKLIPNLVQPEQIQPNVSF